MSAFNEPNNVFLGIDLGTTNSVAAFANPKKNGQIISKVIELPRPSAMYNTPTGETRLTTSKHPTISSSVYYRMENGYKAIVGEYAKQQYSLRPHLVSKSIKSQMGNPVAEGLSPDVPDKTPSEISARILGFIREGVSKTMHGDVTEAVITVPANFDTAMCKATLDAAKLAGFKVRNDDGSEKPVLLPEPKAVLYDLVNQINNGEFPNVLLDLTEKKRILVFDLGGGTLDITLHDVAEKNEVMKIEDIAANRYTRLGGDDFDEELAKAMYENYLKKYSRNPEVVSVISQNKDNVVMPVFRTYAENLKIEMNEEEHNYSFSQWDDSDGDDKIFDVGGPVGGIGYAYDDSFTRERCEEILSVFMANELHYDDYKNLDRITNTNNIIYPILDVLKKASDKLGVTDIKVDAVVVNGGMSKFYMVVKRLKEFFGFEPIAELDPDLAVARGAAVYHYYLKKHEELKNDMKLIGTTADSTKTETNVRNTPRIIEIGKNINNDSLYLGVKNGVKNNVHEIIPASVELPYTSEVMTGFRIEPGNNRIFIPIKSRNNNGTYRTIAKGNITFNRRFKDSMFVSFRVQMGINKIITMNAWTSSDEYGVNKIDEGTAEIVIDNSEQSNAGSKVIPPKGSILDPKAEIETLKKLYRNFEKNNNQLVKSGMSKRISACVSNIESAGNKDSFAEVILRELEETRSEVFRARLFYLARKLGDTWSASEKKKLSKKCMEQIAAPCLRGEPSIGKKTSADNEAIYTLCICGNSNQLHSLEQLHDIKQYRQACIYTHGKTGSEMKWLVDQLFADIRKAKNSTENSLQFSAYAIGTALRKDAEKRNVISAKEEVQIVKKLCSAIESGRLKFESLVSCIIALGCICDQRTGVSEIDVNTINKVLNVLTNLEDYCREPDLSKTMKSANIAKKMVKGESLNFDEEQFLLEKIENNN